MFSRYLYSPTKLKRTSARPEVLIIHGVEALGITLPLPACSCEHELLGVLRGWVPHVGPYSPSHITILWFECMISKSCIENHVCSSIGLFV